jgi:hypothetical protein
LALKLAHEKTIGRCREIIDCVLFKVETLGIYERKDIEADERARVETAQCLEKKEISSSGK